MTTRQRPRLWKGIVGTSSFMEMPKPDVSVVNWYDRLGKRSLMTVKKLQVQHARAKDEFENEVKLISNVSFSAVVGAATVDQVSISDVWKLDVSDDCPLN
ncbi:hypothetical protein Tco_0641086 [Tanacetum coccineum]